MIGIIYVKYNVIRPNIFMRTHRIGGKRQAGQKASIGRHYHPGIYRTRGVLDRGHILSRATDLTFHPLTFKNIPRYNRVTHNTRNYLDVNNNNISFARVTIRVWREGRKLKFALMYKCTAISIANTDLYHTKLNLVWRRRWIVKTCLQRY